jgi:hypothetical protein
MKPLTRQFHSFGAKQMLRTGQSNPVGRVRRLVAVHYGRNRGAAEATVNEIDEQVERHFPLALTWVPLQVWIGSSSFLVNNSQNELETIVSTFSS